MKYSSQDLLLSEFKKAIIDCPNYGSVSFVAHFHDSQVVRIEHGTIESMKISTIPIQIEKPVKENIDIQKNENRKMLLSKKETATLLGISLPTINRLIKSKEINVVRIGGRVLISSKETDRLMNPS